MVICAAVGCSSRSGLENTTSADRVSFHKFPNCEKTKKIWVQRIKRVNYVPNRSSKLCCQHFTQDQFVQRTTRSFCEHIGFNYDPRKLRLIDGALPTIFDHIKPETARSSAKSVARKRFLNKIQAYTMVYLIVEFCNNGDIALVPDNWMSGEQNVYWPPYKTSTRLNNAVVKKEPRSDSWSLEPIKRILYKNESYEKVRAKLRTAEEESDLQTDDEQILVEGKRKRRKPNWSRISSSDESDDELQSSVLNSPPPSVQLQRLQSPHTPRPPPRLPLLPVSPIPSTSLPMSPRPMPGANGSAPVLAVTGIANQALATQILTLLEVLKEELFEQRRVLQLLVSNGTIEDRAALPEGILFPLSTTEEMDSFNDILRVSDSYSSVVSLSNTRVHHF